MHPYSGLIASLAKDESGALREFWIDTKSGEPVADGEKGKVEGAVEAVAVVAFVAVGLFVLTASPLP